MNKTVPNNVCAVIPAAGRSSRMKLFKPLLKFDEKITFIEKIVDEFLNFGCDEIVVIVNEEIYNIAWEVVLSKLGSKVIVLINDKIEFERYYSIKLGLKKLTDKKYCFIHNCDNPFINQEILSVIFKNKISDGYVSPVYNKKGGHPILISEPIINNIIHSDVNDANFRDVIHSFPYKRITVNDRGILTNINTKSDYQQM